MSAKDQVLQLVNYFKKETQLKDKTNAMGDGLLLSANLADEANERSKSTDAQFDFVQREMSNKDVVSSAEILAATVGSDGTVHPTLKKRLDDEQEKTTAQFAQTGKESKLISAPYKYEGAIVTFVDDDAHIKFSNIWKTVCDSKGIKVTLGLVPDWITSRPDVTMSLSTLKSLRDEGYDFVSHTWSHDANIFKSGTVDLAQVAENLIEDEFKKAQDWMKDNGFPGSDTVVYPWGGFGYSEKKYKRIASKYYKNGLNSVATGINNSPYDNMYMSRCFINKNDDISKYKALVDEAISKKSWLVFGTHSNGNETSVAYLNELVDYIQSKSVPIQTFNDAINSKGNVLSIGEYTDSQKFFVGHDGKIETNQIPAKTFNPVTGVYTGDINDPITIYPMGMETIINIPYAKDTLFYTGGVMRVYRSDPYYSYATFITLKGAYYIRFWKPETSTWGTFVEK